MKKTLFAISLFLTVVAYSQDTIITRSPRNIILCKIYNVDTENGNVFFSKDNTTNSYSISQLDYCSNTKVESLIRATTVKPSSPKVDSIGFHSGSFLVGGNISFAIQGNTSQPNSTSLTLLPEWVGFTSDQFALVFGIGYTYKGNGNSVTTSLFDINFGGRYYFLTLAKRCRIYNDFTLTASPGSTDSSGTSQSTFIIKFNAGLGLNYFLTNKLVVDFRLTDLISYTNTSVAGNSSYQLNFILNRYSNIFHITSLGLIYKL